MPNVQKNAKSYPPALFLDRDGVINLEQNRHIWQIEDFIFCEGVFELCAYVQSLHWNIIIITNQSAIAQQKCWAFEVERLHRFMIQEFAKRKVDIHPFNVWYCPHHPSVSACFCRKPGSLWFERALAQLKVEPTNCWMIGDRARDLLPAKALGMHTVHKIGTEPCDFADYSIADLNALIAVLRN